MSKIRILPEILSNKIAAGEVVERPSSVVKELIENALDAGSTRIIVEIEKGGRSLIRVADNGTGMNHDDALLSLERYATSKIYQDRDLFEIRTLGFRGEALPSIASVSRFSMVTKDAASDSGTQIIVEGGRIKDVSETGAPTGTMVTVKQLFYNTPARRKFLKTVNTEMGHIADTVSRMALSWPSVQFRFLHNGRAVQNWPISQDPTDRIADILGKDLRAELHPMAFTSEDICLTGWVSSARVTRTTSRGIFVYVNGRFVHDRTIQHALFEGYRGRLMKGQFPVAVLFFQVPFDRVDVNVHPTKHEVRFAEQKKIHASVADAVSDALRHADAPKWVAAPADRQERPRVAEASIRYASPREERPDGFAGAVSNGASSQAAAQDKLWEQRFFSDLRVIGQLHNTYIVCEAEEAVVLVDQHAAHERILFEQLQDRSEAVGGASQVLLLTETIDLGYREADLLNGLLPDLRAMGLDIEPFGGNTFAVKAVPSFLGGADVKPLILEIVEAAALVESRRDTGKALEQCLITMSCHGAIRANQALSKEQMQALLEQLDGCVNPSHCPHGRPTWIQWTAGVLGKSFRRTV